MLHGGAKKRIDTLALALESSILVNSTGMSWQHVCLSLKLQVVVIDDQAIAYYCCRVVLVTVLLSHAGDVSIESY
jgi:DNA-directed RNA polymerase subunit N (RpoN/RPB10)